MKRPSWARILIYPALALGAVCISTVYLELSGALPAGTTWKLIIAASAVLCLLAVLRIRYPRWRPRFSLRSLVVFQLLAVSGVALGLAYASPWALERTFENHTCRVRFARFLPDGRRLLTVGTDGIARVCDASSGEESLSFRLIVRDRSRRVVESSIAISHDGKLLAFAPFYDPMSLWDLETGKWSPSPHLRARAVDFSPDGKLLAIVTGDAGFCLRDMETGAETHRIEAPKRRATNEWERAARFSPDGSRVAWSLLKESKGAQYGTDRQVLITDVGSGEELLRISCSRNRSFGPRTHCLAFSPDGSLLAADLCDRKLLVLEAQTGKELLCIDNDAGAICWSPYGSRLAATSPDFSVSVWDARTGACLAVLQQNDTIADVDFPPDGERIVTASSDKNVRIYRRRRPEWWWGVFYLTEFWVTVFFAALFAWSVVRDRRAFRKGSA